MKTIFKLMRGSIQFLPTLGLLTGLAACTDYLDEFKDEYDETFAAIEDPTPGDDDESSSSETKAGSSSSTKLSSDGKGSEPADGSNSSGKVGSSSSTKGTSSSSTKISSDSMDDIPLSAGVFGVCAPIRSTFELDERVTWSFKRNTETSGYTDTDYAKATYKWDMPGGSPATYDGDYDDVFIETSYESVGTKTASVSVTIGGSTQEISCSPVMVIPATESSSSDPSSPEFAPTRVGPVSQYGQLKAGKNSAGKGGLYGSCAGVKDGGEVQVRGMSLYWSLKPEAMEFWTEDGITTMVKGMNIEVVRATMAVVDPFSGSHEWNGMVLKDYLHDSDQQKSFVKMAVEAAIKNDIYVIIDWHLEDYNGYTSDAVKFFEYAAKEYGQYDNVIFEIWNEYKGGDMDVVKEHANQVIAAIRKYSDNLVLVGSPSWSVYPNVCATAAIQDSEKNYACTLHFFAATQVIGNALDAAAEQAISSGVPVFASEWSPVEADGNGNPNENSSTAWTHWMEQKGISWTAWSASKVDETSAAFTSSATKTSLQYTTSGGIVKGFLPTTASYTACKK